METEVCPICLDSIDSESQCLPKCGHHFHIGCIQTLSLYENDECPLCRELWIPYVKWNDMMWKALIHKHEEDLVHSLIEYGKKSLYPFDRLGHGLFHPVLRAYETRYSWRIIKELLDVSWYFSDLVKRSHDDIKKIYPYEYREWDKTKTMYQPIKMCNQQELCNAIRNDQISDHDIVKMISMIDFSIVYLMNMNPMITAINHNRLNIVKALSKVDVRGGWRYSLNCNDKLYQYAERIGININRDIIVFLKDNNI